MISLGSVAERTVGAESIARERSCFSVGFQIFAAVFNAVAAVCNVALIVLLWKWYGPSGDK